MFVAQEVSRYIEMQVTKIGRVNARLEEKNYTEMILPKDSWSDELVIVSSMRLDTIIASVFSISRQRAKQLIDSEKVKLNWRVITKPDFPLDLLDILSIRGYGRIQIQRIEGTTKKEKIRLALGVLRK